jgi:predicted transcriptional regulator
MTTANELGPWLHPGAIPKQIHLLKEAVPFLYATGRRMCRPLRVDKCEVMVCNDGMAIMTHRTTFALDGDTVRRLKKLALRWQVSQAEVVRRALSQAEKLPDTERLDVLARLKRYHAASTLNSSEAETYIAQVRSDRKRWRRS